MYGKAEKILLPRIDWDKKHLHRNQSLTHSLGTVLWSRGGGGGGRGGGGEGEEKWKKIAFEIEPGNKNNNLHPPPHPPKDKKWSVPRHCEFYIYYDFEHRLTHAIITRLLSRNSRTPTHLTCRVCEPTSSCIRRSSFIWSWKACNLACCCLSRRAAALEKINFRETGKTYVIKGKTTSSLLNMELKDVSTISCRFKDLLQLIKRGVSVIMVYRYVYIFRI